MDSPFHSGDIAAFVPGGRALEILETAIFYVIYVGRNVPYTRSATHRALTPPLQLLARGENDAVAGANEEGRPNEGSRHVFNIVGLPASRLATCFFEAP